VVRQEVFLFDGTVRDNIAHGAPEATDADIESAARKANAHDFGLYYDMGTLQMWFGPDKRGEMNRPTFDCTARALCL
jgi:ABC-type transport system involved in cytochrome bd biosynthesis fused ATPase/permease subunit